MYDYKIITAVGTLSILLFSSAPLASAQTTPAPFGNRGNITEQDIYHPPEAYVLNATGTVDASGNVNGTITFWNKSDDILGDLKYTIDLLGELPAATTQDPVAEDNSPVYDTVFSKESFVLLPGEKKDIPYTYSPPKNLPAGAYRLEITIGTSRGRTMGWFDVPVRFSGEQPPYAELFPKDITIAEYGEKSFGAETGPNVGAGKSILITANARSQDTRLVAPIIDIYKFSPSRKLLRSIRGSTINANQDGTAVAMTVPTFKEAGVYVGILSLRDPITNERISNNAKYRWVVRGKDADILHVRMNTYGSKENEVMSFTIDYVGAGDAETKTNGNLEITLRDDAGILKTHSVPDITLDDSIRTGKTSFVLQRNLVGNAVLDITMRAENGTTLATHEVPYPFTADQIRTLAKGKVISRILLIGGSLLIIAGAVLLANAYIHKKRKR